MLFLFYFCFLAIVYDVVCRLCDYVDRVILFSLDGWLYCERVDVLIVCVCDCVD